MWMKYKISYIYTLFINHTATLTSKQAYVHLFIDINSMERVNALADVLCDTLDLEDHLCVRTARE